ncbi:MULTISPECIES: hypothetical protein [unclassified Geodermatophilus]|uniref:hypothetical protein n=1 Tax=unclassified Geodermatophilus TaxID=2637632 RepID=UPI003EEE7D0F
MPVWTVRTAGGEDERVEAELLATEGGALIALSAEGLMSRAWAPGHWRTVRQLDSQDTHSAGIGNVLAGLPRR